MGGVWNWERRRRGGVGCGAGFAEVRPGTRVEEAHGGQRKVGRENVRRADQPRVDGEGGDQRHVLGPNASAVRVRGYIPKGAV
jgi:hypothetical protein